MEHDPLTEFVEFAVRCGGRYLACGGPSSRLEERLCQVGARFGYRTEVFATPTGLFVTAQDSKTERSVTLLKRVKDGSMRLNELQRLERILESLVHNRTSVDLALKAIDHKSSTVNEYPLPVVWIAVFTMGVAVSVARYSNWTAGFLSGIITTLAYLVSRPLADRWKMGGVFSDFINCLLTLILAGIFSRLTKLPFEDFAIGSFILMVPGLTLTTAISELANQDFVSGTSKMMKGMLTLLAMGTAYVFFLESSASLLGDIPARPTSSVVSSAPQTRMGFDLPPEQNAAHEVVTSSQALLSPRSQVAAAQRPVAPFSALGLLGNLVVLVAFSIIFQVPRSALPWAVLTGFASWGILNGITNPAFSVMSSFFASLTVGVLSLGFGRVFKLPSQVYSVPGILALLPGMLALSSLRSLAAGQSLGCMDLAFHVALIGGAIAFGLFTARIPFELIKTKTLA